MAALNAEIPEEMKRRLKAVCAERHVPIKEAVERAVSEWIVNPNYAAAPNPDEGTGLPTKELAPNGHKVLSPVASDTSTDISSISTATADSVLAGLKQIKVLAEGAIDELRGRQRGKGTGSIDTKEEVERTSAEQEASVHKILADGPPAQRRTRGSPARKAGGGARR